MSDQPMTPKQQRQADEALIKRLRVVPADYDCAGRNSMGGHSGPCQCEDCTDRVDAADALSRRLADCERLEQENVRLKALLDEAAPMVCPECGPHTKIDEDACCATCGADCAPTAGHGGTEPG